MSILSRLAALEAARNDSGQPAVSFLERMEGGLWGLSCGLWDGTTERSTHQTEAEAKTVYEAFLKRHRHGKLEPVLIIDDL